MSGLYISISNRIILVGKVFIISRKFLPIMQFNDSKVLVEG